MADRLVRVHDHDWKYVGERWGEGANSDTLYVDYRCGCGGDSERYHGARGLRDGGKRRQ